MQAQLHATHQQISRLVTALAAGAEDLPSVRTALLGLEGERERLEAVVPSAQERATMSGNQGSAVSTVLETLGDVRNVLAAGSPEERKTRRHDPAGNAPVVSAAAR